MSLRAEMKRLRASHGLAGWRLVAYSVWVRLDRAITPWLLRRPRRSPIQQLERAGSWKDVEAGELDPALEQEIRAARRDGRTVIRHKSEGRLGERMRSSTAWYR